MEALNNYLSVEELRFGDRLGGIAGETALVLHQAVPRFLLQPLVENALKHGQGDKAGCLHLRIGLERTAGGELQVCDAEFSQPTKRAAQAVFSYAPERARLHWHYGNQARFSIRQDGAWRK